MAPSVIVLVAVRNELHNLRTLLPSWKAFAQHIILCDQCSEDGTRAWLAEQHPDVHVVHNDGQDFDERLRSKLLTEYCRKNFGIGNVLLYIDADETLCSGVFTSLEWKSFCNCKPGTAAEIPWINFWWSPRHYIWQAPFGSISYNRMAFIDDGRPLASQKQMHGMRGPGGDAENVCYFSSLNLLHYGYVPRIKNVFKQNWYKVWWKTKGGRDFHTNRNHNYHHAVGMESTRLSPDSWFKEYRDRGIDIEMLQYPALSWHALDVLRKMKEFGESTFYGLDIWSEVDWEQLRKQAISLGHRDISIEPLKLPPMRNRIFYELSRGPGAFRRLWKSGSRFFMRKLMP